MSHPRTLCRRGFGVATGLLIASVFGLVGPHASAAFIPATDFTGGDTATNGGASTQGYSFTTMFSPVTIDALGLWSTTPPAGQTVRLYLDGASVNLASANIASTDPISSTTANGNQYRFHTITPVTLLANTTYDIVADDSGTGEVRVNDTGVSLNSSITFGSARQANGMGLFPTSDASLVGPYFGPTFEVAVPEPGSVGLLAVAAFPVLLRRRRSLQHVPS